jgi:hypothetical protein
MIPVEASGFPGTVRAAWLALECNLGRESNNARRRCGFIDEPFFRFAERGLALMGREAATAGGLNTVLVESGVRVPETHPPCIFNEVLGREGYLD